MILLEETVKRHIDEITCDWCGVLLKTGETVWVCLAEGTCYCCRSCAAQDELKTVEK